MPTHFLLLELDAPSGFQMDWGPFSSLPPLPNWFVFSFQQAFPKAPFSALLPSASPFL